MRIECFRWTCCGWSICIFAVLAIGSARGKNVAKDDAAANAAAQGVHDEAVRILNSIQSTVYQHDTEIDEKAGVYRCDCSGFVGYVLNRTAAKDNPTGPLGDKKKRPLAMDYEKFFEKAPAKKGGDGRWQQITKLADARPGDVIAWRHEVPKPGNTGHVVIVDQRPVVEEDGLVRVVVIDSTTKPQVDDTRAKGTSGVGRGSMWFIVDADGHATGYVRGSRTAKPKNEAISIGRALQVAEKPASRRAA
jgi:hypothetical protein